MTATKPEPIHVLMAKVMADVGAIGKNRKADAKMGGYSFRGIDDLYNALHKPLAEHGVFFAPEVLDETESSYKTSGGATMRLVRVKVRYRFHGPAGDCVEAVTIGEAADTGDKAANKAMTAALKYLLFQVFCIAVEGDEDADAQAPEFTERVESAPEITDEQIDDITHLLAKLGDDAEAVQAKVFDGFKVSSWDELNRTQADNVVKRLTQKVAEQQAAAAKDAA